MNWLLLFIDWLERRVERCRRRDELRMRVDRAPHPTTLDSLGQERLQTHVRTRPDLT